MGMNIHNGWKFPSGTTLEQVFLTSRGLQTQLNEVANDILTQAITRGAANYIDRCLAHAAGWVVEAPRLDANSSPMGRSYMDVLDRKLQVKQEGKRDRGVDTSAAVVIIPHATGLYAMSYCENETMLEAMTRGLGLESFQWVDSDAPEGMPYERWRERRDLWDELLGEPGVASLAGLTLQLVLENHHPPEPERGAIADLSCLAGITQRAWNIAMDSPQSGLDGIKGLGATYRAIMELRENPTEEFSAFLNHVQSALPNPIPQEWLYLKLPQLQAACQARILENNSAKAGIGRPGGRL